MIGFGGVDTEGLPAAVTDDVIVTSFNDPERLREDFVRYGDRLACFVVEPLIGAGGLIPATREYLQLARQLTHEYGALLIFDEVVNGFRFRAGNLAALYGIEPDLAIYGKAIGGGMPVAALAGREEVMGLIGRARGNRVAVLGGTYCAHPSSMLAAKVYMSYLVEHEDEVYPRLARLGQKMRDAIESGFAEEGVFAAARGTARTCPAGARSPWCTSRTTRTPRSTRRRPSTIRRCATSSCGPRCSARRCCSKTSIWCRATVRRPPPTPKRTWSLLREGCRRVARRVKPYLK